MRTLIKFVNDILAIILAWWFAYLFRFNFEISPLYLASLEETLPWVIPIQAASFFWFGLYREVWRYVSLHDLRTILYAVLTAATTVPLALFMLHILAGVPRSVLMLDPILLLFMMGGSRITYRLWKERRPFGMNNNTLRGNPVLVLGAGGAAVRLLKELSRSVEWRIVGLLDDNLTKRGKILDGVQVLGPISDLPILVKKLGVLHAIIAMPSATHSERRLALNACSTAGVKALTVPSYDDLISGKITVSQIRNVELDDLLGRDPVRLDNEGLHRLLEGKTIFVSGAGGSIGSELCRQITKFKPAHLVFFELNEFALYNIEQEFRSKFPNMKMVFVIGDVKNQARLTQVFSQFRPEVVFHAAAYKHVPLMEQENAWQAVLNNVLGTWVIAQTSIKYEVEKFVLISTDKAVNPTNVMGASKRLAEMVCQAIQHPFFSGFPTSENIANEVITNTRFVIVRFGNVLGSTGSVIPKFREQIAMGGPVTVTHPEITRYFMSIPEATQLVLQAGSMGGEKGDREIFVLDMGEPVKIADLARDLIRLSGFSEEDINIVYSGLRSGEKLYEELLSDDESTLPTPHNKLRVAQARQVDEKWLVELMKWLNENPVLSDDEVKRGLVNFIPEYSDLNSSKQFLL
ncbi:polysaccharide biosynthesis protein [Candidatus Bathyarchaeota archaeon]|nr:polysaccharide biosynthesis protein [Candidatus Bathyarchaeota archaeon]